MTNNQLHMISFAGYEMSLELPVWLGKLKVKNEKLKINREFFEPVWLGLRAAEVAVVALPVAQPWRISLPRRLEAQLSMVLGTVLVGLAVAGVASWAGPMVYGEVRQIIYESQKTEEMEKVEQVTFADYVEADPVIATITPASQEFSVVIPKIQVNSVVIPRVNANDKTQYMAALKQGLAHAAGTSLPGEPGDTYIFGHSTDYEWNITNWNALFYNLKDLEPGDKVYVWYQGMPKIYQVTEKKVYEPKDTSFINLGGGEERLVLQTCTPPGTTWKRLVVFAKPL